METTHVPQDTQFHVITYGDIIEAQKQGKSVDFTILSCDYIVFPAYSCWTITSEDSNMHYKMDLLRVDADKAKKFEWDTKALQQLTAHAMCLVYDTQTESIKLLALHENDIEHLYSMMNHCLDNYEYDFTIALAYVDGRVQTVVLASTEDQDTCQQEPLFTFDYKGFDERKFLRRQVKYVKYSYYKKLVEASRWDNQYYPLKQFADKDDIVQQRLL
jgi:hypothetical protein